MAYQINFQWRITKYNPAFRDDNGHYTLKEEWTCPSEIGKIIDGKEFTLDEYFRVESAYLNTVSTFLKESGLNKLRVLQLSKFDISPEEKSMALYEKAFDELDLQEDLEVNPNEIRTICKMILRNFGWCQLYSKGNFFVNFGWDYYMYIGSSVKCASSISFAKANGLFVEDARSPYCLTEEEIIRRIEWKEKNDEDKLIVGEEELIGIPLNEYRKLFNLSEEHPVIGSFSLTNKKAASIQKFMKHQMDFSKYEYVLWGGN
ncbi:hypothetical protein JIN86_08600 [Lysinibacillus sp. HST-98]|uniref:DUF7683 domain-containing protein n=1 Tax=Lysinibacillus sp. HST-98 TaxID=2800419 RepID=UPI0019278D19|nr:hypothetical protein [Lysinibacillus sp. HST-98]MBL3729661.1 hypothetical protein [Lysinibacillus sp. HST-98]